MFLFVIQGPEWKKKIISKTTLYGGSSLICVSGFCAAMEIWAIEHSAQ